MKKIFVLLLALCVFNLSSCAVDNEPLDEVDKGPLERLFQMLYSSNPNCSARVFNHYFWDLPLYVTYLDGNKVAESNPADTKTFDIIYYYEVVSSEIYYFSQNEEGNWTKEKCNNIGLYHIFRLDLKIEDFTVSSDGNVYTMLPDVAYKLYFDSVIITIHDEFTATISTNYDEDYWSRLEVFDIGKTNIVLPKIGEEND